LPIEKRVQASQAELVAKARQNVTDELKSQVSQKDAQIDSLARTVEELKRKLEQGSQQTQGEAFELESLLRGKFPLDLIEPVAKGETGGDIVHTREWANRCGSGRDSLGAQKYEKLV
jgi:hypothetical protein